MRHKFFTVLREGAKSVAIVPMDARMVDLQPLGTGIPFFLVNSYPYFIDVVKLLGTERPVVTLIGKEEAQEAVHYSIVGEAAEHVKSILERQPQGPYMIGGCSASGIVAYEIAQQLIAKGHEISLLVVFDVVNPYFMKEYSRFHLSLAYNRAEFARLAWREVPRWMATKIGNAVSRTLHTLKLSSRASANGPLDTFHPGAFPPRVHAARKYRPKPYDGPFLLFKGYPQLVGRYLNPHLGWREVVRGKFQAIQLSTTDHMEIFKSERDRAVVARSLCESFAENGAVSPSYRFSAAPALEGRIRSLVTLG